MSDIKPTLLADEMDIVKEPIAVDKASPDQKLHPMSRIRFNKMHTVEHNVKVMNVGKVSKTSLTYLILYYNNEFRD